MERVAEWRSSSPVPRSRPSEQAPPRSLGDKNRFAAGAVRGTRAGREERWGETPVKKPGRPPPTHGRRPMTRQPFQVPNQGIPRPPGVLLGEYAVSRDVFLRIRDVLVGKCRAFGSASGGGPRRTPGNSTMYIVAENTRPRPCNPHRISPRGCGAAAATRGKTRGNLDRSRGKTASRPQPELLFRRAFFPRR